jgi:rare lipoprotein A
MVVGSIPEEAAMPSRTARWATNARDASVPVIPNERQTHIVQAASFQNEEFAHTLRRRLASLGPASVVTAQVAGRTWYRVRLGPYSERHDADEVLRAVVSSGSGDARIVRN